MHFPIPILLLAYFRLCSPFVLRLRPMKEIANQQKNQIIRPTPETIEVNPKERMPLQIEFKDNKPQCGPVPFPDFSCEVVTCKPKKSSKKPEMVPLHLEVETICDTLPPTTTTSTTTSTTKTTKTTRKATTTATTTRKTIATTKPNRVLQLKVSMRQFQQEKVSTMSTIPFGWDESQQETDDPIDLKVCEDTAKCDVPVWNR